MNIKNALFTVCILLAICGSVKILFDIGSSFKGKRIPNDPFYAFEGGWGHMNIPLIKPFHMLCFDGKIWNVDEDGGYSGYKRDAGGCSIGGVQRFNGSDSLFLFRAYGGSVIIKGKRQSEGWFIISITDKTFNGYPYYEDFRDTVFSKYQTIVDTLSWRTPDYYYKKFKKDGTLSWFPDSIWLEIYEE
jgi:hypothetical protein